MANALFVAAKKAFLDGDIDLLADTIKADLIDAGVVDPLPATHDFYDDISAASEASSSAMGTKATTGGAFDAADVTWSAVTGNECEDVVVWKDTATPSTSPLIADFDTASGLPVTPNGGDITVQWAATSPFIFAL